MRSAKPATASLNAAQRRLVVALTGAAVMLHTLGASFNYILDDMLRSLGSSASQSDIVRQMPTIGAFLVVFVAGALGERLGARRVLLACCALYVIGSGCVSVAQSMPLATTGLLLANIGKSALFVVALAALSSRIRGKGGRASGFAAFSTAVPFSYLFVPLVAGVIVESMGWRWVSVVWIGGGVVAFVMVWLLVAPDEQRAQTTGEMVTPALAGLVLALAVESITLLSQQGLSVQLAVAVGLGAGAVVALVVTLRRTRAPSMNLAPLRDGGLVLLLVVLILTLFANLFFYMTMALQYVYRLSPVEVALAMAPAQLSAVLGAMWSGRLVRRWGITRSGSVLMVVVAAALFVSATLRIASPLWFAIVIVSIYAAAAAGSGVAVTNAVMDRAPEGGDGAASAFRSAAANLGTAIGVAGMTGIVMLGSSMSLNHQSVRAGIEPSTSAEVARSMAAGASSEDASSLYAVPVADVTEIDDFRRQAYLVGFRAHGVVGGAVTVAAAVVFFAIRRRQERESDSRTDRPGAHPG